MGTIWAGMEWRMMIEHFQGSAGGPGPNTSDQQIGVPQVRIFGPGRDLIPPPHPWVNLTGKVYPQPHDGEARSLPASR
jgi:hypothetical protein